MSKSKRIKKGTSMTIEIILVVIIAACMIFLNYWTTSKISELQRVNRNSIFIDDDLPMEDDGELVEELKTYLRSPCKMIELYDEHTNLLFQITFDDDGHKNVARPNGIKDHRRLTKLIGTNQEGQATLRIGHSEQDVYYKWIVNSKNEKRLIIIYNEIVEVKGIWLFSFVCYIVMILVFILFIRFLTRSSKERVKHYEHTTNMIKSDLR